MKKPEEAFGEMQVGDSVFVQVDGQKISGTIESFQLKAGLVDVRIFEPGHRKHCLMQAFLPYQVSPRYAEAEKTEPKSKAKSA